MIYVRIVHKMGHQSGHLVFNIILASAASCGEAVTRDIPQRKI